MPALSAVNNIKCGNTNVIKTSVGTTTLWYNWYAAQTDFNANTIIAVDSRIANKSATTSRNIFTTMNPSLSTYVRNVNCWAYDIDLTCISPWNNVAALQGQQGHGTVITPRHIILADHTNSRYGVGATVRYVTTDNQIIDRTVVALSGIGQLSNSNRTDIAVGLLNSDLPSTIKPCKVLPDNYGLYYAANNTSRRNPGMMTNQYKQAFVGDTNTIQPQTINVLATFYSPTNAKRQEFYGSIIGGDSGAPNFIIVNNELVLQCLWWFATPSGPSVWFNKSTINQLISAVDASYGINTGYTLTDISLSAFNTI